ncbi:MAG: hypothetical protein OFPI_09280 [Osedax symbiont Rs2]|nr:MAG: hypothetical protein OFPI_09280 [Osedax symbiont Rs2]
MKTQALIVIFFLSIGLSKSAVASSDIVRICHGSGGYPPYHFYPEQVTKGSMQGATIDILKLLFEQLKLDYEVKPVPWKRCYETALDARSFDIIADGSYNLQRADLFYYSIPLYKLTPSIFIANRVGLSLPIKSAQQISGLKLCANRGTNLKGYGLNQSNISLITFSIKNGLEMVKRSRCEGFLSLKEIVAGHYLIDKGKGLPQGLKAVPLSYAKLWTMHLMISRNAKNAEHLILRINQAIMRLQYRGEFDKILQRYQ